MHKTLPFITLWEQMLQSQSIEEERTLIEVFNNELIVKNIKFRVWHHLKTGQKTLLNEAINSNQKTDINEIGVMLFVNKTETQLPIWKPKANNNIWRLCF